MYSICTKISGDPLSEPWKAYISAGRKLLDDVVAQFGSETSVFAKGVDVLGRLGQERKCVIGSSRDGIVLELDNVLARNGLASTGLNDRSSENRGDGGDEEIEPHVGSCSEKDWWRS